MGGVCRSPVVANGMPKSRHMGQAMDAFENTHDYERQGSSARREQKNYHTVGYVCEACPDR
jgi:hypothetical protein